MGKRKNKLQSDKKKISRASRKMGKAPGTINYLGHREKSSSTIKVMDYDESGIQEFTLTDIQEAKRFKDEEPTSWIDVIGINDEVFIEQLGKTFNLNPLFRFSQY